MFEEEAERRKIQYRYFVGFHRIMANIDRVRVEEILSNMVSNAIKYTGEGGRVDVDVRLAEMENGQCMMTAVVKDTGIGISEEFLPDIFNSFERERNDLTNEIQGTGPGMGITKRLLDIMEGTIDIQSRLGVGTTVTVQIPFESVAAPELYRKNVSAEDYADRLTGKRILLAEDNDFNAEIATEIFEQAGLIVEHAADGVACVAMLCNAEPHYYDAIIMDVQMPNLDGYAATQKIRRLNDQDKASVPIVAMTANAFEEDRRQALEAGMNGFVSKPVEMGKMFEVLIEVMG